MSYQTGTWLPWFIKRYVFRQKSAQLKPLYTFDDHIVADIRDHKRRADDKATATMVEDGSGSGSDTKV